MLLVVSRPRCSVVHDARDCEFQVAWSINPHMQIGAVDSALANRQHAAFVEALRTAGAQVLQLPFIHGAFDSVFMKDSALLVAGLDGVHVLPATARFFQRADEPLVRARQLARTGARIAVPASVPLEGGDVAVDPRMRFALMGHGVRTSLAAAASLEGFLGCDVVPVRLRDEALFHLDTALVVLRNNTIVLCEEALDAASLRAVSRLRGVRVVSVAKAEAMRFSLNIVEVNGTIVTGTPSVAMTDLWHSLGYAVVTAPLDQFQLAGGSAACLVSRVHELPQREAALGAA